MVVGGEVRDKLMRRALPTANMREEALHGCCREFAGT